MKPRLSYRKSVICVIALAVLAGNVYSQEKSRPSASGFSFDVYGDSRSMMYLPYKEDQEAEARKLMVNMFELCSPQGGGRDGSEGCQADL